MSRLGEIIRNNKLYVWLCVFIIVINLLVLADWMAERYAEETAREELLEEVQPEKKTLFDEEDIELRQERIQELATEDPPLYMFLALFNLMLFFVILVGLILDVYFIVRWLCKKPVNIRINKETIPAWSIGDVVRATLIFLSFGYVFVILQSFVAEIFPILYNENFRMIFNTAAMNIVGISVILYFVIKKRGQNTEAIGLTSRKPLNGVFYAVVGYIALVPVLLGIMMATLFVTKLLDYRPPVQPIVEVFIHEEKVSILWLSTMFAAVFGPIAEEIFFRGFMYPAVKRKTGIFWSMMITSAIFSFLHTHIVGFLPIMVLGILLAYLYEKTGSLVAPITVHIIHNIGMVFLVFLVRYIGV